MKLASLLPRAAKYPKSGVLSGNLLKAARAIQPGKGVKLEADTGESYVLIRTEDFEHVCERAGMRARYSEFDGGGEHGN